MKLITHIQEKYKDRNKLFLSLDVLFSILTLYFAFWILFAIKPRLIEPSQSIDFPFLLVAYMTLSIGLVHFVRVIEMLVTGKRNYFALTLSVTVFTLSVAIMEFYWLFDK